MAADGFNEALPKRYPALQRLGERLHRRRVPSIRQMAATECGAACLAMVLGYHGSEVRLDEVRDVVGTGRDGLSALSILQGAQMLGLRGRGIRVELDELEFLPTGTILHWALNHFVVLDRVVDDGVKIVDPASGRRTVSMAEVGNSFSGVALVLEPSETFVPQKRNERPLWRQLKTVLRRSNDWVRILVVSLLLQLFALGLPLFTGAIVDRVVPRADVHLLGVVSTGLAMLVAFELLSSLVRAHLLLKLRTELDARMTLGFVDHLLQLPFAFFQRRSTGDLLMRTNSNATIREILAAGVLSGVIDGMLVLVYLVLLLAVHPRMALLTLGLAFAQVAVLLVTQARQRELLAKGLQTQAVQESYLVEMLNGIQTIKAMGAERRAGERWSNLFVDEMNVNLERGRLNAVRDSVTAMLRTGSPLLLLVYGSVLVVGGAMSLGAMLAITALAQAFLAPLSNLMVSASQLQLLAGYADRIDDVLLAEREQSAKPRPAASLRGRITLDAVAYHYQPSAPPAVSGVSLDIPPGSVVALVGASGSGKSTLANLLLGLYAPSSGRVRYDGIDLTELDLPSVRRQLGIVTQESHLFAASIRANISLANPEVSLDAVERAARRACIHDEIMAMPMGYDTVLGDAGNSLSGGQRQRVCLARALVHEPAVLLLDEATSALDALNERQVQEQLAALRCTRILIAHRLSTIKGADLIVVMDQGRIVEAGTHADLLARRGLYYALVRAQLDSGR